MPSSRAPRSPEESSLAASFAPRPAFETEPFGWSRRALLLLGLVLAGTVLLRLPTFFEPPWHSDEGIFAAVAERVLGGGGLYSDAWESKPPLFLFTYIGLFKLFGAGIFGLRLASTVSALLTEVAIYAIGLRLAGPRRALIAAAVAGFLLSVPFWEGTLALTEIFAVLPTALAVLCVIESQRGGRRREAALLLGGGILFGVAFLIRQTSGSVALALLVWLVLTQKFSWRAALLLGLGAVAVIAPVIAAFAFLGSFHWFWDANVGFFFRYVPSGKELPYGSRPVIVLPVLVTVVALVYGRFRRDSVPAWGLPVLWLGVTLASALLTGRPYSHYMLQAFPPLGLVLAFVLPALAQVLRDPAASLHLRTFPAPAMAVALALAVTWGYVVTPMFAGNVFAMRYTRGPSYYPNFAGRVLGIKSEAAYDNYFDRRVIPTAQLERKLASLHASGQKVYIWGEYPWLYALAGVQPASRFMTSFEVLLIPYLDLQLEPTLARERPQFVIVMDDAKPKFYGSTSIVDRRYHNAMAGLTNILARDFQEVATVGKAHIYARSAKGAAATTSSQLPPPAEGMAEP